jgi:hypothetical protein
VKRSRRGADAVAQPGDSDHLGAMLAAEEGAIYAEMGGKLAQIRQLPVIGCGKRPNRVNLLLRRRD